METKTIDFLQIGFTRCGTNFLLENVYPYNPHLECVYPVGEYSRLLERDFILADGFEYDRHSFERKFADIRETVFTNEQAQVRGLMFRPFTSLSERRFDRKTVIDRINESFPEVKIIMFIRNQQIWILGWYTAYLRDGGLLGFYDFVESILTNDILGAHYIDWFPLVSYLYKLFGSERVLLCLYEELKESPQDIANRIFDFLEVPRIQIDESPVNPSLSKEVVPLKRFFNHLVRFGCGASNYSFYNVNSEAEPSKISKLYGVFEYTISRRYGNELCRAVDKVFGFKGRLELGERHLKMIEQRYSSHNRKLSELLNIDLSGYGYP